MADIFIVELCIANYLTIQYASLYWGHDTVNTSMSALTFQITRQQQK